MTLCSANEVVEVDEEIPPSPPTITLLPAKPDTPVPVPVLLPLSLRRRPIAAEPMKLEKDDAVEMVVGFAFAVMTLVAV